MKTQEIIDLAKSLRNKYGTKNPFEICKKMNIEIQLVNYHPSCKAYILKPYTQPIIYINSKYTYKSQLALCAHELGHAIIHNDGGNHFLDSLVGEEITQRNEYEANLFAIALLFNESDFCVNIASMNNYILKGILDYNIALA